MNCELTSNTSSLTWLFYSYILSQKHNQEFPVLIHGEKKEKKNVPESIFFQKKKCMYNFPFLLFSNSPPSTPLRFPLTQPPVRLPQRESHLIISGLWDDSGIIEERA